MFLDKDAILKVDDLKRETVKVPEWGGEVQVRCLTGLERDRFEMYIFQESSEKGSDPGNIRAKLCAMTIVGEDGKRLFTDKDVGLLGSKNAQALDRVYQVARRLSGLSQTQAELEEEVKNFGNTLPENSTSS